MKHIWKQLYPNAWIQLALLLCAVVIGCVVMVPELVQQQSKIEQLLDEKQRLTVANAVLERQQNTTALELKLEQQSQQETTAALTQQRLKMDELEKELAFYRSIMAPETIVDGVVIHDFVLDETTEIRRFRFQLVLTQQKVRKRYAKGFVEISVDGSQEGKPMTLDLIELSELEPKPRFSFRYFQQFEGEFVLPPSFVPERIRVNVTGTSRKAKNENTYPFADLVSISSLLNLQGETQFAE
ncbi:DUF6776 family protein [Ferrimonas lipolytica]|uniref:Uncharacterized protein n=1 Tax=Ferrimonas lipolytica TaxID=2724191 RepID=A0A6H1UIQ6_9GAMM|nr:DUF6776 family protein [Ferrimonas lipolytica]QIZ78708.1 hypothetical protein HER31_18470 [Ferrimonas lipolytica]